MNAAARVLANEISLPTGSKFGVMNENPRHRKGGLEWAQKFVSGQNCNQVKNSLTQEIMRRGMKSWQRKNFSKTPIKKLRTAGALASGPCFYSDFEAESRHVKSEA